MLSSVAPVGSGRVLLNEALGFEAAEALRRIIRMPDLLVLTGAGVSTDSGIPDYRSPGRPEYKPIWGPEFQKDSNLRLEYWAKSALRYPSWNLSAAPNRCHTALGALYASGGLLGVVTQNVDGLHIRGGVEDTVELHGTLHTVVCPECGQKIPRSEYQSSLEAHNRAWFQKYNKPGVVRREDGMVTLPEDAFASFRLAACFMCGSQLLRPRLVFHGESLEPEVREAAKHLTETCSAMLVLGTTLTTASALRLVRMASKAGKPVGIVNVGDTRGDEHAQIKVEGSVTGIVDSLVSELLE